MGSQRAPAEELAERTPPPPPGAGPAPPWDALAEGGFTEPGGAVPAAFDPGLLPSATVPPPPPPLTRGLETADPSSCCWLWGWTPCCCWL